MFSRAKSSVSGSRWLLALAGFLLVLLPILAILQYRWIGEVSAAERARMESNLRVSSGRFAEDFSKEIFRLVDAFQLRNGFPDDSSQVLSRYQAWMQSSPYPDLVEGLQLLKTYPGQNSLLYKIDLLSGKEVPIPFPSELQDFVEKPRPGGPNIPVFVNGMLTLMSPVLAPRGTLRNGRGIERVRPPFGPREGPPLPASIEGWTIIELNRDILFGQVVPDLVERHFPARDDAAYRVALIATGRQPQILYSSEGTWTSEDIRTPDASISIFGGPPQPRNRRPPPFFGPGALQNTVPGRGWMLLVKHRLGSLETAVRQVRQRNLEVSFGILLILGAGVITVLISSQRARTLGRLQMEFAAGVSHELRTPLSVIRSAAHNLQTGVVQDHKRVEEYAGIVQDEARRLSEMVDQVLLYSETESGHRRYDLKAVDLTEVVERATQNLAPTVNSDEADLNMDFPDGLPLVRADAGALMQCVQNLLSNAFKYGKDEGHAQITITARNDAASGEVQLSVCDKGPGIDKADQLHLFEPFHRGASVGSTIPGSGLGLHLVRKMMQAQNGDVTFEPSPQGGACFTLHIPVSK